MLSTDLWAALLQHFYRRHIPSKMQVVAIRLNFFAKRALFRSSGRKLCQSRRWVGGVEGINEYLSPDGIQWA